MIALALILLGCGRQAAPTTQHFAVLRFENLTPDVSLNWMGRAASEIIAREIGGTGLHANPLAQFRPVSAPGESTEYSAAIAGGATRLVLGQISRVHNRLILDVTVRDPATGKTTSIFTLTAPNEGDLYGLADAAAHHLSTQITPFESHSNPAIAAWAMALEESDPTKASGELARAVQTDPDFASAWLALVQEAVSHGDRAAAENIVAQAQQHANRFSEVNRARLKLIAVELTGNRAAALAAMNDLGRLLPDDAENAAATGEQNFEARQFQAAAAAYRRLTRINPNNALGWNQLGYTLMYLGDYDGAMSALQTYQRVAPNDVNPLDSQGDVAFAFGRFAEAEKLYEQSASKDPTFENSGDLYKAAESRLMTGDVTGADRKFEAYAAARRTAKDGTLPLRTAQWRFLSGKHGEAWSVLENLVKGSEPEAKVPQFRSLLLTQMAIWDLQLGRRERALQESGDALRTGSASPPTLIIRFACEDARSAADWSARADRMLAAPQMSRLKPVALAYALYLSQQWQAAEPLWKQLLDQTSPNDSITPAIYAQILVELQRTREAEPLVRLFPIPHPDAPQEFLSLALPKFFDTRAAVLAAEGKTPEAEGSRKVFRALWGGQ